MMPRNEDWESLLISNIKSLSTKGGSRKKVKKNKNTILHSGIIPTMTYGTNLPDLLYYYIFWLIKLSVIIINYQNSFIK